MSCKEQKGRRRLGDAYFRLVCQCLSGSLHSCQLLCPVLRPIRIASVSILSILCLIIPKLGQHTTLKIQDSRSNDLTIARTGWRLQLVRDLCSLIDSNYCVASVVLADTDVQTHSRQLAQAKVSRTAVREPLWCECTHFSTHFYLHQMRLIAKRGESERERGGREGGRLHA